VGPGNREDDRVTCHGTHRTAPTAGDRDVNSQWDTAGPLERRRAWDRMA